MARELGDRHLEARALSELAALSFFAKDPASRQLIEPAVAIAREIGDIQLLGETLDSLAILAPSAEENRRIRLEILACTRQSGDELLAASQLHHLHGLDLHAGLLEESSAHLGQAIAMTERLGGELFLYFLRSDLGLLLLIQGRHAEAAPVIRRCLLLARRIGVCVDASEPIFGAACCVAWQGDHLRAARLHGAADVDMKAALEAGTIRWSGAEERLREKEQGSLRELMGDGPFDDAYRLGAELSSLQAVELALGRPSPA